MDQTSAPEQERVAAGLAELAIATLQHIRDAIGLPFQA
jgi:hypothetical protein